MPRDAQLRPFLARVHKTDHLLDRIDDVNRTAIGDIDAEGDIPLVCDETVAAAVTVIPVDGVIDHRHFRAVDLLRSDQGRSTQPECATHPAMNRIQAPQRFRLVARDHDSCNAAYEPVLTKGEFRERIEALDRQLVGIA